MIQGRVTILRSVIIRLIALASLAKENIRIGMASAVMGRMEEYIALQTSNLSETVEELAGGKDNDD